jgi:hypothetical protein
MATQSSEQSRVARRVSGVGALRMVIASIRIDRNGWGDAINTAAPRGLLRITHDATR